MRLAETPSRVIGLARSVSVLLPPWPVWAAVCDGGMPALTAWAWHPRLAVLSRTVDSAADPSILVADHTCPVSRRDLDCTSKRASLRLEAREACGTDGSTPPTT